MISINIKRLVSVLLCIVVMLSSVLATNAASIPSKYLPYVDSGRVDYKDLYIRYFKLLGGNGDLAPPISSFTISVNGSPQGYSDSGAELKVKVGDTLAIQNTSTKGSGKSWSKCDFQISDGTDIIYSSTLLTDETSGIKIDSIKTDKPGTYNIYLNVMDNENMTKTEGWGNWAYNGTHRAAGTNPGGGTGYDFPGWWYYSKLTVLVEHNKPTADFSIEYQGDDVTDNKASPATINPGNMSLVLRDNSTPFSAAEPITARKWYYWNTASGWKEISGSTGKTTVNISNMDSDLPGSAQNKAFKLVCTSSSGGEDYSEHTSYFNKVLSSGYIVYYRDIDTDRDIYPPKERPGLGFGTYIEHALPAPKDSELVTPSPQTMILNAAIPFTTITFYYEFTAPPENKPPVAILETPEEVMAGEVVRADGSKSRSNNPGGYIADYYFEYEGANLIADNRSNVRIWYPNTGTYEIYLQVEDENGDTDSMEKEIKVTPPVPTAVISITGKLKENRKVTISSSGSTSPTYYPIDTAKTTWTITAVSGGTAEDIKYTGTLNGNVTKNILFKKAGTYRTTLTVTNTYGRSASASQTITIAPDLPPVARILLPTPEGVKYKVYRDPDDSNYATFEIFNESYSPDGDTIDKAVVLYCYDSDNDGDYKDEQWYYSIDGTTWQSTGMDYANTVSFFNIFDIDSNEQKFTLKSKEVGNYWFTIRVMEDIPEGETIPEFIIEDDYKRDDDFTAPNASEDGNINPVIDLNVTPAKKPVDIVILTDYTGTKLSALNTQINALKAQFSAVNVDPVFHLVSGVKKIGTQNDELYWYRRYARLKYQVNRYQTYTHNQSWNYYYNYNFEETLLWEQKQGLASQVNSMPKRNPSNVNYSKSSLITWVSSSGNTTKRYYNVTITCANDVKTSGLIEQEKYYDRLDGNGAHYSWDSLNSESVSIDSKWTREEKISNVTYDVFSLDLSRLNTLPLRNGSDRHMIFLSDATDKNYGAGFGNYFCFGDMTDSLRDYIAANKFALYGIVPDETRDRTLLPDKVSKILSLGNTTLLYMKNGEAMKLGDPVLASTLASGEKIYPVPSPGVGDVKEVIEKYNITYLFTHDGLIKYVPNGTNSIITLPGLSGITKVFSGGSYVYAIDSNGKVYSILGTTVEAYNNSFFCDKVITIAIGGPAIFIATNGIPYMRYYINDRLYKTESYNFIQARIKNRDTGAISYLGAVKDIVSYGSGYGSYGTGYCPVVVQYQSDWIRQFVGFSQTVESNDRYYIQYPELLTNPVYNIDEISVDRIESSGISIFVYKKNGIVKMLATDWKYVRDKENGNYWASEFRSYLVNVPLPNVQNTYRTSNKYFLTDSNDVTYLYDAAQQNETPVIGTTLKNMGTGVKKIQERFNSSYRYVYVLYNDGTVRQLRFYNDTLYNNTMLPYDNIKDIYSSQKNTYLLTLDGRVYAVGDTLYGQLGYKGSITDTFVDPLPSTLNFDTTKTYLSILDIFKETAASEFYPAGQYTSAFNSIYKNYENTYGVGITYIILGDNLEYHSAYSDYESDPEHSRKWRISHDPYYFDNSMGLSEYHMPEGFTTDPPAKLDKVGKYIINLKARDNPKDDNRFDNYRLWSLGNQNLTVYVHRKPAALQRITIEDNGNETYTVRAYDAGSYDLDHTSWHDKGIVSREWRWRDDSDMVWHYEQMNKTDCDPKKVYTLQFRVRDFEGVWSDYNTIEIANNPPIALFTIEKNPIFDNEKLLVKDQSVTQSFASLVRWHWVIKKYNEDDTLSDTNIFNDQFSTSNNGTGEMEEYDTNIKTDYFDTGAGKYRLYLRVRDSNGLWSDCGTDSTYNLNSFYAQDFVVQESFKMSNFRVAIIRDFHLEQYYNVNGKYPDRPFYVNSMAIDPENFMVGGISVVQGFSSLTKGYRFEFEIDTTNFNEEEDTIIITPTFYTYTSGVPGVRGQEADLYWEDSNKDVYRVGDGGHSRWKTITLDSSNRTITGENEATWRGEYFIPATSWPVPLGTPSSNAKSSRINADIIVNFRIKGYSAGELKYDYNLQQWPIERTSEKHPYEIGDVIRYDYKKSSLNDTDIIINRP